MEDVVMTDDKEPAQPPSYPLLHVASQQSTQLPSTFQATNCTIQIDNHNKSELSENILEKTLNEEGTGEDEVDNVLIPPASCIEQERFFHPMQTDEKRPVSGLHGDQTVERISAYVGNLPEPPKLDSEGNITLPALDSETESVSSEYKLSTRSDPSCDLRTNENALYEKLQRKMSEVYAKDVTVSSTSFSTGSVSLSDMESMGEMRDVAPVHFDEEIDEEDRGLTVLFVGE